MSEVLDPKANQPLSAAPLPGELPREAELPPEATPAPDEADVAPEGTREISAEINADISAEVPAVEVEAAPELAGATTGDAVKTDAGKGESDDKEAIEALRGLSTKLFVRVCRRVPLRTFLAELERLDRSVFYRYFKGYRPQKIDAQHMERVLRKEIFENGNGLLAQLVIYNWDEAEWRLYGQLQKEVKKINEDVEAIEHITDEQGDAILGALEAEFDKRDVYIATVLNGVRVSKDYLARRFADLA